MSKRHCRRGLSLLETALSFGLVAMAVLAVVALLPSGIAMSDAARRHTVAELEAQSVLALARSNPPAEGTVELSPVSVDGLVYTRTRSVTRSGRMKRVAVVVAWERRQITREVEICELP